jgi:putative two-component system response regulator
MKKHARIGAEILAESDAPILKLAEEIALTHHERWDGTGYPNGLAGEEIPLSGRIVAVTDVFDALSHTRPYKKAWPVSKCVQEIQRLSGLQFDPRVVDAMVKVLSEAGVLKYDS